MANVPDEAVLRAHEINPQAYKLYTYYCLRRNQATGVCFPSLKRTSQDTHISYTYCSEMRTHLLKSNWIEVVGNEIKPIMGDFEPEKPKRKRADKPTPNNVKKFGNSEDLNDVKSSEIPNSSALNSSEKANIVSEKPKPIFGNSETLLIELLNRTIELNHSAESAPFEVDPEPGFELREEPDETAPSIQIYRQIYNCGVPTIEGQYAIIEQVKNLAVWTRVLSERKLNNIPASAVGTLLKMYHKEVAWAEKDKARENGSNQRTSKSNQAGNRSEEDSGVSKRLYDPWKNSKTL